MPPIPTAQPLVPFWETTDHRTVRLYHGHVIDVLRRLPSRSVQMCVTSPPYWGLRDYQTDKSLEIGSEPTIEEFVTKLVEVFREVRRVLRNDGTVWLNLGDSYSSGGNVVGAPWRVAFALQADGWILRQDIIWAKPNPMTESVENRCTKSHEYIFLLAASSRYYYDADAIKTDAEPTEMVIAGKGGSYGQAIASGRKPSGNGVPGSIMKTGNTANKRSVWSVASESYPGAHYATFPTKLITPCILAGTSEYGACVKCGSPWRRVVEKIGGPPNQRYKNGLGGNCKTAHTEGTVAGAALSRLYREHGYPELRTVGWEPTCICGEEEVQPCIVLDPFIGSGTTAAVCIEHGRHCVGIDLSLEYLCNNAIPRVEGMLRNRPALSHLLKR